MKYVFYISLIATVFLSGCRKTKLEDEKSILEGKWKWVSATETRTVLSNGNKAHFHREASEFPDDYFVEFERKGKINFLENSTLSDCFRIVFAIFNTSCNELNNNCNQVNLLLNNKSDQQLAGFVNSDTLTFWCSQTNLPLQDREEGEYRYDYQYFYVKVN